MRPSPTELIVSTLAVLNHFSKLSPVPIYVYETLPADGTPGEQFEIQQSMKEAALTAHPETGEPVRRIIQRAHLATKYTPKATDSKLSNENVESKGFTKYEKDKLTGRYHKVAGKQGPSILDPKKGEVG